MNEKSFRTKFTMNYTPCGMYDHRIDGEIGMWSTLTPNLDRIYGLIGYMIHFLWTKPCTIRHGVYVHWEPVPRLYLH